jgi:hypothetical protein
MATTPRTKQDIMDERLARRAAERSFDIIVERKIGTVESGRGDHSPLEAAYLMLANHPEPGTFKFTMPAGMSPTNAPMSVTVTQEFEGLDREGNPINFGE